MEYSNNHNFSYNQNNSYYDSNFAQYRRLVREQVPYQRFDQTCLSLDELRSQQAQLLQEQQQQQIAQQYGVADWQSDLNPAQFPHHNSQTPYQQSYPEYQSPVSIVYHSPLSDSHVLTEPLPEYPACNVSDIQYQHQFARSMSLPDNDSTVLQGDPITYLPPPKQIRFVTNDGQPHAKRRRINAACLTCRKRKTRCSGERPECKTCTDNNHSCLGYPRFNRGQKGASDDQDDGGDDSASDEGLAKARTTVDSGLQSTMDSTRPQSRGIYTSSSSYQGAQVNPEFRVQENTHTIHSTSTPTRLRVPFFRYFGPTAIAPGFKQMVVQLRDRDHRRSTAGDSPVAVLRREVTRESSAQDAVFYEPTSTMPNPPLITHLCRTFFKYLGCNYPFLRKDKFMRDLEEKKVDTILVDAVCAISARFSDDKSLLRSTDSNAPVDVDGHVKRAFRGHAYSHRAGKLLVETFGCPTIAVAQACLLLAYEEFGTDRDSGSWMFLGTAIRMAQDTGIQKLDGMNLVGRKGPTPKIAKMTADQGALEEVKRMHIQEELTASLVHTCSEQEINDRRMGEANRVDTFWAIFLLDRYVSSGLGRPVTLQDNEVQISFPYHNDETPDSLHPDPYPVLTRIVHLYGRIADVLNGISTAAHVSQEELAQLSQMEKDLTGIYQRMSTRLYFNATNFQHYVKTGLGSCFIMLHFWFHTSIILLHQPTLLHSFDIEVRQLFIDSRDLSMSSAKTIADILAFAELIDFDSVVGNPFTSQPMYVAACAFLAEARAFASQPPSRQITPPPVSMDATSHAPALSGRVQTKKLVNKHSLLASAANQNYQRCYKGLKLLNEHWAGCRYILTALDQKATGLLDPMLFTKEDLDGEMPPIEPRFNEPGWRRYDPRPKLPVSTIARSPSFDWDQAIGWSLTGTANSPAPALSFIFNSSIPKESNDSILESISAVDRQHYGAGLHSSSHLLQQVPYLKHGESSTVSDNNIPYDLALTENPSLLGGLNSRVDFASSQAPTGHPMQSFTQSGFSWIQPHDATTPGHPSYHSQPDTVIQTQDYNFNEYNSYPNLSDLQLPGGNSTWTDYLPKDVLDYFAFQQSDVHDTGEQNNNAYPVMSDRESGPLDQIGQG